MKNVKRETLNIRGHRRKLKKTKNKSKRTLQTAPSPKARAKHPRKSIEKKNITSFSVTQEKVLNEDIQLSSLAPGKQKIYKSFMKKYIAFVDSYPNLKINQKSVEQTVLKVVSLGNHTQDLSEVCFGDQKIKTYLRRLNRQIKNKKGQDNLRG